MLCRVVFYTLLVSSTAASVVVGQTPPSADSIRAAIKDLENKLQDLEQQRAFGQSNRTTRIGESKAPVRAEDVNRLVVQLYDLGDLFAVTPTYAAIHQSDLASADGRHLFPVAAPTPGGSSGGFGGGMGGGGLGGGGGGFFAIPSGVKTPKDQDVLFQFGGAVGGSTAAPAEGNLAGSRISLEELMDAIQTTIEPDQWDDAGGDSSMARIGNSLLISTTDAMHHQIGDLLQLFRKRWGTLRTVSVRAYWLWLTERQLDGLLIQPKHDPDQKIQSAEPFGLVATEGWKKLLAAPSRADNPGNYFATVTGYNGQTVHTLAGNQRTFVTGVTPVVGSGPSEKIGYTPTMSVVQEGAALQVTPLTSTNAKYVVLDVHSRVSRVLDPRAAAPSAGLAKAPSGAAQEAVAALDRPIVATHRLSTTLRVPTGDVLLVGGLSNDNANTTDGQQLYLFVQAFVQELRDDPVDDSIHATQK